MKNLISLFLLLTIFLFWGCETDPIMDPVDEAIVTRTVERPFKTTGFAYVQLEVPDDIICDEGLDPRYALGQGNATHLGLYDIVITGCDDMTNGVNIGQAVHTAANGDILYMDYVLVKSPNEDDPPYISRSVFSPWTINGDMSTGRFEGATGTGTGEITVNFMTGRMEWEGEGTITY